MSGANPAIAKSLVPLCVTNLGYTLAFDRPLSTAEHGRGLRTSKGQMDREKASFA